MSAALLAQTLAGAALAQPDSTEGSMVDLTNRDRTANGLPVLQIDPEMIEIARQRASAQQRGQPLQHYDAAGQLLYLQLLKMAGIDMMAGSGENLARHFTGDLPAIEAALMASPPHRSNILHPAWTRVAIGAAYDPDSQGPTLAELFR